MRNNGQHSKMATQSLHEIYPKLRPIINVHCYTTIPEANSFPYSGPQKSSNCGYEEADRVEYVSCLPQSQRDFISRFRERGAFKPPTNGVVLFMPQFSQPEIKRRLLRLGNFYFESREIGVWNDGGIGIGQVADWNVVHAEKSQVVVNCGRRDAV